MPKNLKPYKYELLVFTNFDATTEPDVFDGVVKIFFTCIQKTNHIFLHQHDLDIVEKLIIVKQLRDDNATINVIDWKYDNQTDLLDLRVSSEFQIGKNYSLSIHYQGNLKSNNVGFYKSYYNDVNGNKRYNKETFFNVNFYL